MKKKKTNKKKQTTKKEYDEGQSHATKIGTPFVKEYWEIQTQPAKIILQTINKIFKPKIKIKPFKKPLLQLIRSTKTVEFYENATPGTFRYEHSNGKIKEVELNPQKLLRYKYRNENEKELGKYSFNGYIQNENSLFQEPEEPIIDAEKTQFIFEKSLADTKNFEARLKKIQMEGWQQIILAIAALAAVILGIEWISQGAVSNIINNILGRNTENTASVIQENITILPMIIIFNLKKILKWEKK